MINEEVLFVGIVGNWNKAETFLLSKISGVDFPVWKKRINPIKKKRKKVQYIILNPASWEKVFF